MLKSFELLKSYINVYRKSSAERECRDDRALSKLNFFFHLKSKKTLVTLKISNSHLKYYQIYLSFSIKLQEIN